MTGHVAVGDVEIAYEEHGRGSRPLVLVHGFTGSRRDFAPRLAALAAQGRVLALDLRGHGGSSRASSYTLEQLAADLVGFLDALGIASCDLLGHSMGGMAALRAVLAAPERVASLILMDTAARAPSGIPRELVALAGRIALEQGMERLVERVRAYAASDPARTEADRQLEARWGEGYWTEWRIPNFRAMDPVAYGALGAAILDQVPLGDQLGAIRCPTLVLVGEGDTGFLAAADELAAAIPTARRTTLPGAGHQPQLETPDAWLAALREHLREVRQAGAASPFPSS
jgi:pimeloyl-ACP methyl ester carboxylesterase